MNRAVFCLVILAIDGGFALLSSKSLRLPSQIPAVSGIPVSILAGIAGIALLVLLNFVIAALVLPKRGGGQ
ncbi:MAG: hypothetical protein QM647_14620 [Asticcacaulis sp.]|uniref:hypothetical protein n=1 Tax=Asticcacaulis sp. TaxID=1872648 RepID=UPI0039E424EC